MGHSFDYNTRRNINFLFQFKGVLYISIVISNMVLLEMTIRIYRPSKTSMQSGFANTKKWRLGTKVIKEVY